MAGERDRGDVDVRGGVRGILVVTGASAALALAGWLLALAASWTAG